MEPDVLSPESTLQAIALLSAIPVVGLALWAESFKKHLDEVATQQMGFDREAEQEKIRFAGIFILILQFTLFLVSSESRSSYPLISNLIFITAIILQFKIQSQVEKKLKPAVQWSATGGEEVFGIVLRTLTSWFVGLSLQIFILFSALQVSMIVAGHFQWSQAITGIFSLVLGLIGVGLGLILNFALGPVYMKAILPCVVLTDYPLLGLIHECFKKSGILNSKSAVRILLIDLVIFRITSISWVGLKFGRGPMRPTLFISRWMMSALSQAEIQAVVLNQLAEISLKHVRNRFALIFSLVAGTSVLALGSILISQYFSAGQIGVELVGPAVAVGCFLICVRILATQNRKHQFMSDLYTVTHLGVSPYDLIAAITKIDQQSQPIPSEAVHPEAQFRVNALRKHFQLSTQATNKKAA